MAQLVTLGSNCGNALTTILMAPEIEPGDSPSYELCKTIYLYHPLGAKIAESPIAMAQCQQREISIPDSPEDRVRDQFVKIWKEDKCDEVIFNVATLARVYGISTMGIVCVEVPSDQPIPPAKLADLSIAYSVFDALNTAGSLVLNQDPNAIDFQKVKSVAVNGRAYHKSRVVVIQNERPVYIAYVSSAFGFTGRSSYQRVLFPLKSFIQSMITDDLVVKKAGVFIAKLKTAGAIIDAMMQTFAGIKRLFVKEATNGNVISIGTEEEIETLNMQNIDGAYGMARKNILENIAAGDGMPAIILNNETFAEGFGEGTEDAKAVARYIDRIREWMAPLYEFCDRVTMRRAWNAEFYATIQKDFPEAYGKMTYEEAFYQWSKSFTSMWPSLLTEPDSEKVKTDDVKLKAIIATIEVFGPMMDPENKATLIQWAQDNINENKIMFQSPLLLDFQKLQEYVPPQPIEEPHEPKPFASTDSASRRRRRKYSDDQLADLVTLMEKGELPIKANGHLRERVLS